MIADPFARVVVNSDLTEVQIQKREDDWDTIQKYCLKHMDILLKNAEERKK